jgi:DNA-binding transcriptional MerR regulator/methylmalonyl-CoA mutase cobalamin-binding subunit
MGVVTRKTGLRSEVIRAWERRHKAVEPTRTAGNHRLYTDDDIRRLQSIRRVLDAGWHIGQVARLETDEILRLIEDAGEGTEPPIQDGPASGRLDHHLRRCIERIKALDDEGLHRQFEAASVEFGRVEVLDRLLVPLMNSVGAAFEEGSMRIANEHLAAAVVRAFGDSLRGAYPAADESPGVVVATPIQQHHELGALVVAAVTRSEGWRTTYLGPNLPAEELVAAVHRRRCKVLALSITFPSGGGQLEADLRRLGRLLSPDVHLVVGGQSAELYQDALQEARANRLEDLASLRTFLSEVRLAVPISGRRTELP